MSLKESHRYLGVFITDNLTWDEHISHMCAKARWLIGLFFFSAVCKISYTNCSYKALQSIDSSSLEYCPHVWDPFTIKLKQQIESVQKFALRVCLKHWDMPYSDMLEFTGLPTLESRCSLLKLCLTFKIMHSLIYFPDNLYTVSTTRSSSRLTHSLSLRPYSNSSSQFHYSRIPHSISLWNSLYLLILLITRLKNIKNVKGCRDGMPKSMQTR